MDNLILPHDNGRSGTAGTGALEHDGWQRLLIAVRRQAPLILVTTVVVTAVTAVLTMRAQPIYQARATLRMDERPPRVVSVSENLTSPSSMETEIELLRSRSVAEDVVRELALHVSVEAGGLDVRVLGADSAASGRYTISAGSQGAVLHGIGGRDVPLAYDTAADVGGLRLIVRRTTGEGTATLVVRDPARVADALRAQLQVSRPSPVARIVQVVWESPDPARTRDVVNAVAAAYVERRNQMQKQQARAAVDFLRRQVTSIGGELVQAETNLEAFRRSHSLVDPDAQSASEVRRLADLRASQDELEFRRNALRQVVALARDSARPAEQWAALAATPALAGNATLDGLLQQLTTLEIEAARLSAWRTSEDPDLRSRRNTIQALAARATALAGAELQALEAQTRAQARMLDSLGGRLREIPATELQHARLRRQLELVSQLHVLLQTRLQEATISEAVEVADVQIVDPGLLPGAPIRPRVGLTIVFGMMGGLLLGLLAALMREFTDTAVRSREEVALITAAPVLAAIPRLRRANGMRRHEHGDPLVARDAPQSPAAEAYRALRTNIAFSALPRRQALRTLVVTSAEPQDGKSTTAINLAVALAEQGLRVLLVEADQRRPVLHRLLSVPRVPGLTDALAGRIPLAEACRSVPLPAHAAGTLHFLPGGTPVPNPAELAGSSTMRTFLGESTASYEAIVLDTPPLSLVTDAAVTGTAADGVIFVTRMGMTNRESLRRAVEDLRSVGASIVGVVLTDVQRREDRYGHRYDAAYGNGGAPEGA